jgi:hypothetical protein
VDPPGLEAYLQLCLGYTWQKGGDNLYLCANSINDGKYAYNNLAAYDLTWYHKIKGSWHTATESWYQDESQTPNVLNPAASSLIQTNANGAVCATATQLTCFAPEWAVVNYLEKQLSKRDYFIFAMSTWTTCGASAQVSRRNTASTSSVGDTGLEAPYCFVLS